VFAIRKRNRDLYFAGVSVDKPADELHVDWVKDVSHAKVFAFRFEAKPVIWLFEAAGIEAKVVVPSFTRLKYFHRGHVNVRG
jgi:hypothetical protein